MSRAWASGSTRAWRRIRAHVLARDGYQCQLRLPGCIGHAPLHDQPGIPAGHAHHTHGKAVTGDDPRYLAASCEPCNLAFGEPAKRPDPQPRPATQW